MSDPVICTEYPFSVIVDRGVSIRMPDGIGLAATLWRPDTRAPVGVVVEMLPYRRADGTAVRDAELHPWLAGHGIAALRVDLRGTGDSGGLITDEYSAREHADAEAVIAWAAAQPWCNGAVGMTGISWGGFNSLQVAARRPPALKAIIALCASDDRYADDVHYMGGALLTEDVMWSTFMLVNNALPPDPRAVGPAWREMWRERLAASRSWSEHWIAHQRRDDYWRHGSVAEDAAAITVPVFAIAGWEDSYSNFVPRLLARLSGPRLGLVGPWTHSFPNRGDPGPRIGYLKEALAWWCHWLMGEATGIMDRPVYRVWIGDSEPPRPSYVTHRGVWAAERQWPSPRITPRELWLNATGLGNTPEAGQAIEGRSPATAGTDYGRWGGYGGASPDLAIDQRREDGQSLVFDTQPLDEDLILLGAAELDLVIMVDEPRVTLTARLCDVAPDGVSAVFTYGVLNLARRNGMGETEACPVGTPFRVRFALNDVGRRVPRGHRLRLALQTQFWFVLWPQPGLAQLTLASGQSRLRLPVRPPSAEDLAVSFAPAEISAPLTRAEIAPGQAAKTVCDDLVTGLRTITLVNDHGVQRFTESGVTIGWRGCDHFVIHGQDPLSATVTTTVSARYQAGEADIAVSAESRLTADASAFHLAWRLEAREGEEAVFLAERRLSVPRDGA